MLNQTEYIYGVHCGDKDCYSCATQRYNCDELNKLDKEKVVLCEKNGVRLIAIPQLHTDLKLKKLTVMIREKY